MTPRLLLAAGICLSSIFANAWGQAAPVGNVVPHLWAVPGLYGLEGSACGRVMGAELRSDSAMIDPLFCPLLSESRRPAIGAKFRQRMATNFPAVEARFAESLPASATPSARLAASLVASLRITRATIWRVRKPVGTDAFMPITLTLDITNLATGEVVFTRTRSEVAQGTFALAEVDAALVAQFSERLDAAMQALVVEAAAAWKPWSQQATVIGKNDDTWIVDRGRSNGLRTGDSIGADGTIAFAGAGYAVVKPALGTYRIGEILTRPSVQPANLLAKPSVLTVMAEMPDGYAAPYLIQTFEDALGARGGFAPVPINYGVANLRNLALGEAQIPGAAPRALPDYVASVSVAALSPAVFASNIPGVTIERHEAHAFVSLVDRSGRVVATFHGIGKISDQISGEIRFSPEQRRDTVVRNALIEATQQMVRFKPVPLSMPIVTQGSAMLIRDPNGAIPLRAQLTVLRNIGRLRGVEGSILVPVGEVATQELATEGIIVSDAGIVPLSLRKGDVVAVEQAGTPLTSRHAIAQCQGPDNRGAIENRSKIDVPLWSFAANAAFAGHFAAPVYLAALPTQLGPYGVSFAAWDRFGPAHAKVGPSDMCFLPGIAVTQSGTSYTVAVGYTLRRGSANLVGGGMQTTLTPTILPSGTPAAVGAAMLQFDLAAALPSLADKTAAALRPPQ